MVDKNILDDRSGIEKLLTLIDQCQRENKPLETLLKFDPKKKTWKLRGKYQMSPQALEARRQAARQPKRKRTIHDDVLYKDLLLTSRELRQCLDKFIQKIGSLQKRDSSIPETDQTGGIKG